MARMARQTWVRRVVTLGAAAALPLTLTAGSGAAYAMTADGRAAATMAATAAARTAPPTAETQLVTFKAPGCEGCRLHVYSSTWGEDDQVDLWESRGKRVEDGRATFAVPAGRTRGLVVTVRSTWEGRVSYVTHVAFRYGRTVPGEVVTVAEAADKRRASGCWAGTDARRTTLRLVTQKVTVEGATGDPTPGTLAFVKVTQRAMVPMERAFDGVLGSQDVLVCGTR